LSRISVNFTAPPASVMVIVSLADRSHSRERSSRW